MNYRLKSYLHCTKEINMKFEMELYRDQLYLILDALEKEYKACKPFPLTNAVRLGLIKDTKLKITKVLKAAA